MSWGKSTAVSSACRRPPAAPLQTHPWAHPWLPSTLPGRRPHWGCRARRPGAELGPGQRTCLLLPVGTHTEDRPHARDAGVGQCRPPDQGPGDLSRRNPGLWAPSLAGQGMHDGNAVWGGFRAPASDSAGHDPSLRHAPKLGSSRARLCRAGLGVRPHPTLQTPRLSSLSVCKWRNPRASPRMGDGSMGHQALNPSPSDFRPFSSRPRVAIPPRPVSPSLATHPGTPSVFSPTDELGTGELRTGPTIPSSRAWPGTVTTCAWTQRGGRSWQPEPPLLFLRPLDVRPPPGAPSPQPCGAR